MEIGSPALEYGLRGGLEEGVKAPPWPPKPNLVSFTSKFTRIFTNITGKFADNLGLDCM